MSAFISLAAGLGVGALTAALLLGVPLLWAGGVGLLGGVAIWYVVWGRRDLAAALRKHPGD